MMNHDADYNLIARSLSGQLDAAGEETLVRWRAVSAENESTYKACGLLWDRAERPLPERGFDVASRWQDLSDRLGLGHPETIKAPGQKLPAVAATRNPALQTELGGKRVAHPQSKPGRPFLALALAALLVLGILGIFRWGLHRQSWQEMTTAALQRETVHFSDGTKVQLNAGSHLRWKLDGKLRQVHFRGHGFFEVAKSDLPFLIFTENSRVQVVGTEFEVWARNQNTRVAVREGRVALAKRDGSGRVFLGPNQRSQILGPHIQVVEEIDNAGWLGWLEGRLVFRQQTLWDVIFDLEQIFGVNLTLKDAALGDLKITASFENADFETVLSEICLALNLAYDRDGNTTTIFHR